MRKYNWWGDVNSPPNNLKTKRQLAELGLSPKQPVAVIECREYDLFLYDPNNPESVKPRRKSTEKQRIEREFRKWYETFGFIEDDRIDAVLWAREQLAAGDRVILDTETTGLYDAEIVEIAITDCDGNSLLNTLVKPSISIPVDATEIHGIGDCDVISAPSFSEVYPQIKEVLNEKFTLIYNASFDIGVLNYCCNLHNLPSLFPKKSKSYECVMHWYSQWCGYWSDYHKSYKWQALNGGHRALSDCLATLDCLKKISCDSSEFVCPDFS